MEGCFVAGADPELMLVSPQGELVSAIGLVPGTKEKPAKVAGGGIQRDNVMAEFNVDPAATSEEFIHNIRTVLGELARVVAPNLLTVRASASFPEQALDNDEARVFGCDPDFDSWTLSMNEIDGTAALASFRSAGGHFHVGKKEAVAEMLDDPYGKVEVVKMLDVFLGIPSVILDPDPTSKARRALYGRAGAHRPKDYGVEYRALGNFWLRSPELVDLIYHLADRAVALCLEGESHKIVEAIGANRIQEIINTSNKRKARNTIRRVLAHYLDDATTQAILGTTPLEAIEGKALMEVWEN